MSTALLLLRSSTGLRSELALVALFLVGTLALAAATAVAGFWVLAAVLGALLVAVVVWWPPSAAIIYLTSMPFLVGIERGAILPLLRPNEAVQGLLMAALALRLLLIASSGRVPEVRINQFDLALISMAFFGSVVPLFWLALRGEPVTFAELLATVPLWRYLALYVMIRVSVTSPEQVLACLWISVVMACVVTLIAIAQVLDVGAVQALLGRYWGQDADVAIGRGTATLSSSHAAGDYVAFNLAVTLGLLLNVTRGRLRVVAGGVAMLLLLGTLASGQFSGAIALVVVLLATAIVVGRTREILLGGGLAGIAGSILLWPAISIRLSELAEGGLPQSWATRLDNLRTFYLPELMDLGWLLGVRPNSVIEAPELWRVTIFLESGYLWLLWVGGLPLLMAFIWMATLGIRSSFAVARSRRDAVGVAAIAVHCALWVNVVLMLLDPHLTLRGAGDMLFSLMAFASIGGFGVVGIRLARRSEPPGTESRQLA